MFPQGYCSHVFDHGINASRSDREENSANEKNCEKGNRHVLLPKGQCAVRDLYAAQLNKQYS